MSGFLARLDAKVDAAFDKVVQKTESALQKAGETIQFTLDPDHRHDSLQDKQADLLREEIRKQHRFESFAAPREGNDVKWYICGHDYFYALADILEGAQETICIMDWWLTPELFLRRPPTQHEESRIDRILLKKAREGVKIFIIVYKEVVLNATMNSEHTKNHLEALHPNITVMRHPDHVGGDVTLFWSHHEKVVIVDNAVACIGGLDICFGRWDTKTHPIADVHPTDNFRTTQPGQDYNDARIKDFQDVKAWVSNQISRLDSPRMGWQDAHMMLIGDAVRDVAEHFVSRWNFIKELKYKKDNKYVYLAFPHVVSERDVPTQSITRHPHLHRFSEAGRKYARYALGMEHPDAILPFGGLGPKGNMKVQVVRSSADWSMGILTENSIQEAYIQLIREAQHYIYIENQFFITNTIGGANRPVNNLIGQALVDRILSAARAGKKFKVVIVMPAIPGFAGDLQGNDGTLAIMNETYLSLCRGPASIMGQIKAAGFDPAEYISAYNLRSYDRINNDPERLSKMVEASGIDFDHAQAALARIFLGRDALPDDLASNKTIEITKGEEGGEELPNNVRSLRAGNKEAPPTVRIPLPRSYDEALKIVQKFETSAPVIESISDSVAHHAQAGTGSLLDEVWLGSEESERDAFVTEELYIHTKLMIVDDRRVIMGSANLNDRSQRGDHDSEIALVVEDNDEIEALMDGKKFMVTQFASSLRRSIYRTHLGLDPPQFCPSYGQEPVTSFMKPVGTKNADITASPEDQLVADPLSPQTEQLWNSTAQKNSAIFGEIFHVVPSDECKDWASYRAFVPQAPVKPGHVASKTMPVQYIKEQLDQVRGHLTTMPLKFLINEDIMKDSPSVNPLTIQIYI